MDSHVSIEGCEHANKLRRGKNLLLHKEGTEARSLGELAIKVLMVTARGENTHRPVSAPSFPKLDRLIGLWGFRRVAPAKPSYQIVAIWSHLLGHQGAQSFGAALSSPSLLLSLANTLRQFPYDKTRHFTNRRKRDILTDTCSFSWLHLFKYVTLPWPPLLVSNHVLDLKTRATNTSTWSAIIGSHSS